MRRRPPGWRRLRRCPCSIQAGRCAGRLPPPLPPRRRSARDGTTPAAMTRTQSSGTTSRDAEIGGGEGSIATAPGCHRGPVAVWQRGGLAHCQSQGTVSGGSARRIHQRPPRRSRSGSPTSCVSRETASRPAVLGLDEPGVVPWARSERPSASLASCSLAQSLARSNRTRSHPADRRAQPTSSVVLKTLVERYRRTRNGEAAEAGKFEPLWEVDHSKAARPGSRGW